MVSLLTWHKLGLPEKRKYEKKHGSIIMACRQGCGAFYWSMIDMGWGGPDCYCGQCYPWLGWWSWAAVRKKAEQATGSKLVRSHLCGLPFSSCIRVPAFEVLSWLPSVTDIRKNMSFHSQIVFGHGVLAMVFITIIETWLQYHLPKK